MLLFPLLLRSVLCGCAVGKCSVLSNRNKCFASFAAHDTLTATQCSAQRQRKETRHIPAFLHSPFCKTTPLTNGVKRAPYRMPPSYCISALRSNSEKRRSVKQVCRSASLVHPNKRPTTKNALRTARILSTAQAQARSAAQRNVISARICKHETLPPAPARSAVNRTGSVTTGHQAASCSTQLRSKIEGRLLPSLLPSPSFSLHRAPAAAAAFRSATARRAALSAQMRVSFSPAGRKRNGGRIPVS